MRGDEMDKHDEKPDEPPPDNLRYFCNPEPMPPLRRAESAESEPDEAPPDNLRYCCRPQTMPPLRRVTSAQRAMVAELALAASGDS